MTIPTAITQLATHLSHVFNIYQLAHKPVHYCIVVFSLFSILTVPAIAQWGYVIGLNKVRASHGAAVGPDGNIYVVGGAAYDQNNNRYLERVA